MAQTKLLLEKEDSVATITLNRLEKSNAFDDQMISEMREALKDVERDASVRCVVLTGAGKNFCAGQDLGAILDRYDSPEGVSFRTHLQGSYNQMIAKIRAMEKPVI